MGIFVGDYSVQVPVCECSLVYAEAWAYITWKDEPFLRMRLMLPTTEITKVILVGTFKLVTFDVIWFLERPGCNRGCIQGILLKKPQTPSSSGFLWQPSANLSIHSCLLRPSIGDDAHGVLYDTRV